MDKLAEQTEAGVRGGKDLTMAFTVEQTPEQVFAAINEVKAWWGENIEGITDKVGEVWIYHNEPVHMSKLRTTELVPGQRVVWKVLDTFMSFVTDRTEWVGNEIVFEISRVGDKTDVRFTQYGLVPDYDCYAICSSAWTGIIKGSLKSLIATGTGAAVPARS